MTQRLTGPLVGQHILVTRPAGQASTLVAGIEQLGGRATHIPFLAINPVADLSDLENIAARLETYQACIFVSANAVHSAWPTLTRHQPWPETLAGGVVGPGSARALREFGVGRVQQQLFGSFRILQQHQAGLGQVHFSRIEQACGHGVMPSSQCT